MRTLASRLVAGLLLALAGTATASAQSPAVRGADSTFSVDGAVALASLMSLADGHLIRMAGFLEVLASGEARTSPWPAFRGRLDELGRHNVPAVLWFAVPDGRYWTAAGEGEAGGPPTGPTSPGCWRARRSPAAWS